MLASFAIAVGQFLACGLISNEQCQILNFSFDFLDRTISIPIGFSDVISQVEYIYIIVIGVYFVLMFIFEIRLNYRYYQLSDRKLGYSDFSVLLSNVPKTATKHDILEFMHGLQFNVRDVTLVKKTRMFRKMLKYRK